MRKSKPGEPSLRDKLSQSFLETLEADFRIHGATVIEKMRASHPERYAELAGKLIMTAEPPLNRIDFNSANSMQDIGLSVSASPMMSQSKPQSKPMMISLQS